MNEEEKIARLERDLEDALLRVYELESRQKSDSMIRFELEEMLRSIYHECHRLKESEEKPDIDTLLSNLAENIRRLMIDYKIRL